MAPWFVPATTVALTVAFLVGAYGLRPPFDFLLAYAAVGATVELASRSIYSNYVRESVRPAAITSLWFAAGSFLGMLALSLVAKALRLRLGEPGEDVVRHMITMVLGGLFIGASVGLLSAHRIAKGLHPVGPAKRG
jgi:hypothetical protein